ncbi:MAG TPA: hypothetical protein PLV42_01175 [bacterium]|nr:hypothetical protein [bacterium]
MNVQEKNRTAVAAELLTEMFAEVARRFDDAIPAKHISNDAEEFGVTGFHHIVRHYEHLLAWMVEDPEMVSLEHFDLDEIRELAFYAARTGRTEALDLLIERTGFAVTTTDVQGLTLLDHAQRDRQYDVVHYLINRGAGREQTIRSGHRDEA